MPRLDERQPALPGLKCAARAARTRGRASWTDAERRGIAWLMDTWNLHLGDVRRCHRVESNLRAALAFFRRNLPAAAGEQRFEPDEIAAGLKAYREDPANVQLGRWVYFAVWCETAEDRIAAQLARVGYRRLTHQQQAEDDRARRRRDAKRLAVNVAAQGEIVSIGLHAIRHGVSPAEHARRALDHTDLTVHRREHLREAMAAWECFEAATPEARRVALARARRMFAIYQGRVPSGSGDDDWVTCLAAAAMARLPDPSPEIDALLGVSHE